MSQTEHNLGELDTSPKDQISVIVRDAAAALHAQTEKQPDARFFRVSFSWQGEKWMLSELIEGEQFPLTVRIAITSDKPAFSTEQKSTGSRVHFHPTEVTFYEFTCVLQGEDCQITSFLASRKDSPKYFAYSLILQNQNFLRNLIATQHVFSGIKKVTAVIIDGAQDREGGFALTNWSSSMARQIGYQEDPQIEGRFFYQFK